MGFQKCYSFKPHLQTLLLLTPQHDLWWFMTCSISRRSRATVQNADSLATYKSHVWQLKESRPDSSSCCLPCKFQHSYVRSVAIIKGYLFERIAEPTWNNFYHVNLFYRIVSYHLTLIPTPHYLKHSCRSHVGLHCFANTQISHHICWNC